MLKYLLVALFALWLESPNAAEGKDYPDRPIRLISPYAPGGSNDIVTRFLATRLSVALRTPVLVENRAGGGMVIASEMVAHAPADGYTLILVSSGHAINPSLRKSLPYDTLQDFSAVSLVGRMPNVVVVYPGLPVHTVADLVSLARQHPGSLNYSSAGNGSTPHLAAEWFKSQARIDMTHIPYKGTGPSLADLMAGQVSLTICGIAPALPYINSGKLRAIAVTSEKRTHLAPELPTVAENGYPGFDVVTWYGVLAPASTPSSRVKFLSRTIASVFHAPGASQQLATLGIEPIGSNPVEFQEYIRSEIKTWEKVVKASGMHAD